MSVTRVAFLSSEYPPHTYGGLGTVVEALSRFLGARGIEVVMLVPETGDYAPPPPGVTLCPVPVGLPASDEDYWLTYCESAAATARRTGLHASVVHCHDWMTALGGLAIGRALGVPVLMSIHLPQAASYHLDLETIGITGCARVIVNSQAVRAELTEREVSQDKISVIPNGVDLDRFRPGDQSPDPLQILFAGRLIPQKGPDVLLRAFGAVLRRHPDATLTIAGDGTQRLYLERLARFLGLRQRVRFLGWQSPGQLAELYRDCAVLAVPSLYEPFGLVALEAMASGRPVVVSRVGGLAEIVEDEISGFAVEPGDHLDLATRLAALLSDPGLARAMGRAARRRAEHYDWRIIAGQTAGLYDSLASRPGPERAADLERLLLAAEAGLRERALALLVPEGRAADQALAAGSVSERGHDHGR